MRLSMSFLSSLCLLLCSADPSIDGGGIIAGGDGQGNEQNVGEQLQGLDLEDREQGGGGGRAGPGAEEEM